MHRGLGAIAILALAAASCRQIVGIGDAPPHGEAGPAACGVAPSGGDCETCLESSCCAEATACAGSPVCAALEACLGPCVGDPACRGACLIANPVEQDPAAGTLEACVASSCSDACGIVCGGVAELAPPGSAASCQKCVFASGCADAAACMADDGCQRVALCERSQDTAPDEQACAADVTCRGGPQCSSGPAANSVVPGAFNTVEATCAAACGYGNDWTCIGQVTWHVHTQDALTVYTDIYDPFQRTFAPGVDVKLCDVSNLECDPPFAETTSNGSGDFFLSATTTGGRVPPSYGVLELSSPVILPTLAFITWPLDQPSIEGLNSVLVASSSELATTMQTLGLPFDPTLGVVAVAALDCQAHGAPGVTFTIEPQSTAPATQVLYIQGDSPSLAARSTDVEGLAIMVNVPVGSVVLTATNAAGQTFGKTSVPVRAGTESFLNLPPTP